MARNPRVAQLLGRIQETARRARALPAGSRERRSLEDEVSGLYAEIGRYVHWLIRQDPKAIARVAEEGRRWAEKLEESLGEDLVSDIPGDEILIDELPDEETSPSTGSDVSLGLLSGGADEMVDVADLDEITEASADMLEVIDGPVETATWASEEIAEDDLDESFAMPLGEEADAPAEEEDDWEEEWVEAAPAGSEHRIEVVTDSFETISTVLPEDEPVEDEITDANAVEDRSRAVSEMDDWLRALRDVLRDLGAPEDLPEDELERAPWLRGLSAATSNLEVRWARFPDAVQQALLGLVGARARRLAALDPQDADVRLAVGRMRRFAEGRSLLVGPALREHPPSRDWRRDEDRYWQVLHAGL